MFRRNSFFILKALPLVIFCMLLSLPGFAKYSGGTGSEEFPYEIATPEDLVALSDLANQSDWDLYFTMTQDIDMGAIENFTPIAPDVNPTEPDHQGATFSGVFNGNRKVIRNLTVSGEEYIGLFGYVGTGGRVENIGFEGGTVSGDNAGSLAGKNSGSLLNCYSSNAVSGSTNIGGLVGCNYYGKLTRCYATGTILCSNKIAGGLVGYNVGKYINLLYCYSTGEVTALTGIVGGLVGKNEGKISKCYSSGSVSASMLGKTAGGLVGSNAFGDIYESYATGYAKGSENIGGLVGSNSYGSIWKSYARGSVKGKENIGGCIGHNYNGLVTRCYSTGSLSGYETDANVGGLIGNKNDHATILRSFWDSDTSGLTTSLGGTGITTLAMQSKATFEDAGWDFVDVWHMPTEGVYLYPILQMKMDESEEEDFSSSYHSADINWDRYISLSELLRVIQLFNSKGYHTCVNGSEDGFCVGVDVSN